MRKFFLLCGILILCSGFQSFGELFYQPKKPEVGNEINCLAHNIYFEARDQPTKGQIAVALVTLNRVKSRRFPNSICKVIHQGTKRLGKMVLHKCHFSWYCDGKSDQPKDKMSWEISKLIAKAMVNNPMEDFLNGATHYHRVDVNPYWNKRMLRYTTIGDHIFYIDALNR